MDGLSLRASLYEMAVLVGGRIDKIKQSDKDELTLEIRAGGGERRLLFNVSAANNRVHLTALKKQALADAPMFSMLLRKYISGARIISVEQPKCDRILEIKLEARDDFGDPAAYTLYCELMGKYSNLILASPDGKVLDAIKHVSLGMSSVRPVLPGLQYTEPSKQDKLDPFSADEAAFYDALSGGGTASRALTQRFFGLSPAVAEAIVGIYSEKNDLSELDDGEKLALASGLHGFYRCFAEGGAEPCVILDGSGRPRTVLPFMPKDVNTERFTSIGECYDSFYEENERIEWSRRHGTSARKVIENGIERLEKKLALFADTLNSAESMEQNRLCGELITANLHSIPSGSETARVMNYYLDPPQEWAIKLDRALSPSENAQKYYKKYQKQKAARDMAAIQREQTVTELDYLRGQLDNLSKCTSDSELAELIEELKDEGYMKRERAAKKKQKLPPSKPMCFASSDGIKIYVGKNNRQNDALTLNFAAPGDIWLHTKNIPGSHVIIRSGGEPPEATLCEAAMLAAYYSGARMGGNVPVDYTPKRFVKKPSGAKPGMVIYSTNRTLYITPDEGSVRALKREN